MSVIFFKKRSRQNKRKFFIFLKGRYFVMGGLIYMNSSVGFLKSEDFCGFSKKPGFVTFPEI